MRNLARSRSANMVATIMGLILLVAPLETACTHSQWTILPPVTAPPAEHIFAATKSTTQSSTSVLSEKIAETPTSARIPILLPLPSDNATPAPFEGYKSADFNTATGTFNKWMDKWGAAGLVGTDEVGGTLQLVPLEGGGVCAKVLSGSYYKDDVTTLLCIGVDKTTGKLRDLPSGGIISPDDYMIFLDLQPGETLKLVGGVYQAVDAQGKPARYVDKGNWVEGEYVSNEIVWSLKDPEVFPSQSFEYLTSTDFAQQVLDWEAQGLFPQVPDTAVPFQRIDFMPVSQRNFLSLYGLSSIYNLSRAEVDAQIYLGHPEKVPYIIAGVWKFEYQGEKAFFVLKKWKNKDNSSGFEGFIYKPISNNPLAISWELIDFGFGSDYRMPVGEYFKAGTTISQYGNSGCGAYFQKAGGNPNSAFCTWYFDNPEIVYNQEFYSRWVQTGILSNHISANGQKIPFIPISPISGLPFDNNK